jgi:hypothetical protein
MRTRRKWSPLLIVALVLFALVAGYFLFLLSALLGFGPTNYARLVLGEPGALQDVNDAADWIVDNHAAPELETLADRIINSIEGEKPTSLVGPDLHEIPPDMLPKKFWALGVRPPEAPDYIWIHSPDRTVHFHWARFASDWHEVVILPPDSNVEYRNRFMRKVSDRVLARASRE